MLANIYTESSVNKIGKFGKGIKKCKSSTQNMQVNNQKNTSHQEKKKINSTHRPETTCCGPKNRKLAIKKCKLSTKKNTSHRPKKCILVSSIKTIPVIKKKKFNPSTRKYMLWT